MTEWYLDYSAAHLSGGTIRNTPVGPHGEHATGVVRYIDAPNLVGGKHTNPTEWTDLMRSGLSGHLVFEISTGDPDGGFASGQANARRALAGAEWIGYHGEIFFCEDRPSTPSVANWRAYLDGAASVLGINRVGAYGFYAAMDAALGHAAYFWQAGAHSDLRTHVHMWQDNNYQPSVGGIATDRSMVVHPIGGAPPVNPAGTPVDEESVMEMPAGSHVKKRLFAAGRPHYLWWEVTAPNKVTIHDVAYIRRTSTSTAGPSFGPLGQPGYPDLRNAVIDADRPGPIEFASDVAFVFFEYSSPADSTAAIG